MLERANSNTFAPPVSIVLERANMRTRNKPIRPPLRVGEIDYNSLDEVTLLELFALYDKLGDAQNLDEVAHVIRKRAERGEMTIFEHSPTPQADNVPGCLYHWPMRLFWRQRSRWGSGKP